VACQDDDDLARWAGHVVCQDDGDLARWAGHVVCQDDDDLARWAGHLVCQDDDDLARWAGHVVCQDDDDLARWAGHVVCQDDDDLARRVLLSESGGKRPRGRPRLRLENGVKERLAKLGCRNWTVVGLNRAGRRILLKEAEAYPGL
jgi:hypothetical protein